MDLLNVKLEEYDLRKIKEIAAMQGKNPDELKEVDVWGIISAALIVYKIDVKNGLQYGTK